MKPDSQPFPTLDEPISPELEQHLSDPAQKTEETSGEQARAARPDLSPTEPDTTTENQPT